VVQAVLGLLPLGVVRLGEAELVPRLGDRPVEKDVSEQLVNIKDLKHRKIEQIRIREIHKINQRDYISGCHHKLSR
jgi:hypothetical protein